MGLLHLEIVKERLEREYDLNIVITNPGTDYKIHLTSGEVIEIKSAADLPDPTKFSIIEEPWVKAEVLTPREFMGQVIDLIIRIRGIQTGLEFVDTRLSIIKFRAPLATLLTDFYDALKSITSGYGSLNYELDNYQAEDLIRLDFLVASERIDSLSIIVHRSEAVSRANEIVNKLKDIIPKQQFKIAIQGAIGGKFIARADISSFRKDVTAKLYGGDATRRKKLLQKQVKGKERMKKFGKVDIPNDTFAVLLRRD